MAQRKPHVSRPDHVKAGHRAYRILWLENHEWHEADDGLRGVTLHTPGEVRMRLSHQTEHGLERFSDEHMRETLIHEVMHVVSGATNSYNMWGHLKRYAKDDHGTVEELLIGLWSGVLLQVMKDNPELMAYLLDDQEHE